jgi:hypothetical protein
MWLAADATSVSTLVTLAAAFITAAGTVIASVLVIRKNTPPAPGEKATKATVEKPRHRVPHSDRLTRLESWKEQYADPILRRMANVLEWDDNPAGEPVKGADDE